MSTRLVTVCTGSRDAQDQWRHHPGNAEPEAWADFLAEMRLLDLAERHGVVVCVEPETANAVRSAARARDMLDQLTTASASSWTQPTSSMIWKAFAGARDR